MRVEGAPALLALSDLLGKKGSDPRLGSLAAYSLMVNTELDGSGGGDVTH